MKAVLLLVATSSAVSPGQPAQASVPWVGVLVTAASPTQVLAQVTRFREGEVDATHPFPSLGVVHVSVTLLNLPLTV